MKNTTPYELLATSARINDKVISFVTLALTSVIGGQHTNSEDTLLAASSVRDLVSFISDADVVIVDGIITLSNYDEHMNTTPLMSAIEKAYHLEVNLRKGLEDGLRYLVKEAGRIKYVDVSVRADEGYTILSHGETDEDNLINEMAVEITSDNADSNIAYDVVDFEGEERWLARAKEMLDSSTLRWRNIANIQLLGMYILSGAYNMRNDGHAYHGFDKKYSIKDVVNVFKQSIKNEGERVELANALTAFIERHMLVPQDESEFLEELEAIVG